MLGRLVVKLLFKACVPMVAVAGVMSYGVYMKGGDPAKMWLHVASGAFGKAGSMFSDAREDVAGFAGQLSDTVSDPGSASKKSSSTQVFTWKDEDGVTHFGTQMPEGVDAKSMMVDPNRNVLEPVAESVVPVSRRGGSSDDMAPADYGQNAGRYPAGAGRSNRNSPDQAVKQLEAQLGGPLPGVGGQILSSGAGSDGQLDPSQLLRLLQSAGGQK